MRPTTDSPFRTAPSNTEGEKLNLLALHLATLYQPGLARELLGQFGSAQAVFTAPRAALLGALGGKSAALNKILSPHTLEAARTELARSKALRVEILSSGADGFPVLLDELPGMPPVLFALGEAAQTNALSLRSLGIIGSRRPTPYGTAQAHRFAASLVHRGFAITSGLALGIDGEAHRSALDAGGATIAVLGSGLGNIYPGAHRELAARIVRERAGVLISELPCDATPRTFHFPLRNRILSGLSRALLVVEAGEKSGSLITVTHALEQGKTVYALPGRVDRPESLGCLRLLMDGASPVITPDDVLPGDGKSVPAERTAPVDTRALLPGRLGAELTALFAVEDVWAVDAIAERVSASAAEVLTELGRLELDGHIKRQAGGGYARGKC